MRDIPSDWKDIFRLHIPNLRLSGKEATGCCPFHEDSRASFSVNVLTSQWICHAGCGKGNYYDFVKAVADPSRLVPVKTKEKSPEKENTPRKVVAKYTYQSEDGTPVFEVVRYEPKGFTQNKVGGYNMDGVERIPYHLYELNLYKDEVLFWVEGEKDADRLMTLAILSTTTNGGAGHWSDHLADKIPQEFIVFIPDQDEAGNIYLEKIVPSLLKRGKTVLVWNPTVKDVSDFLDGNKNIDQLKLKEIIWNEGLFQFSKEDPFSYLKKHRVEISHWSEMGSNRTGFLKDQYKKVIQCIPDMPGRNVQRIIEIIDIEIPKIRDVDNYVRFCHLLKYLFLVKEFYAKLYR